MTSLLQHLGVYEPESMHSFRRGMAQQMAASGISHWDILQRMLIKTPDVLTRCYLPSGRHQSGVQRAAAHRNPRPTPQNMLTALGHGTK